MTSVEQRAYELVKAGIIRIDENGCLWRVFTNYGNKTGLKLKPCVPRRCDSTLPDGYRSFKFTQGHKGYQVRVSRLVYAVAHDGMIDDTLDVDHIDFNRQNNRPDNLQQLTSSANHRRSVEAGRLTGHKRKLFSDDQIRYIRSTPRRGIRLAEEFKCSASEISLIRLRRHYAKVAS